jgi:hypothetical protein
MSLIHRSTPRSVSLVLLLLTGCAFEPGQAPDFNEDMRSPDLDMQADSGADLDAPDLDQPDRDNSADLDTPDLDSPDLIEDMVVEDMSMDMSMDMPEDMSQDMVEDMPQDMADPCALCAPQAACITQPNGQRRCVCRAGYRGDGATCRDVDECGEGLARCDVNADCINGQGSFMCVCRAGFGGDGMTCAPADPCGMCAPQATCADLGNGQQGCRCRPGWQGTGATCTDIDECATNTANCSPNADCTNTSGSFHCTCKPGFRGDGINCVNIDECAEDTDGCDPLATCQDTVGGHTCTCPVGTLSVGGGTSCQLLASCKQIKQQNPGAMSGDYLIAGPQGQPLSVYCDMVSDGGVGYTMVRVHSASLGGRQSAYVSACQALGLEIVVPRTQAHLEAMIAWNGGQAPNIVNITPRQDNARGLNNWRGRCRGQDCTFFVSPRPTSRCTTVEGLGTPQSPRTLWGNRAARSCRDYQDASPTTLQSGVYKLAPTGGTSFNGLCEMTLDGGAWTHIATTSDDGTDTWTWNERDLWSTDRRTFGDVISANRDYKNIALHDLRIRDAMFLHSPSTLWAAYHDVSDGTRSFGQVVSDVAAPNCDPNSGYAQSAGTLTKAGKLCNTRLYINPGDRDGDATGVRCSVLNGLGGQDQSTYGPAWSMDNGDGCPFDDPGNSGWGPTFASQGTELDAQGYGAALNLNLAPNNSGGNFLQLYVREDARPRPDGDNTQTERLILNGQPDEVGPSCPHGDWDDQGDAVKYTGWVICSTNDA